MRYAGLIGFPVAHSLSPRMQQAAFDAAGMVARYLLWETPTEELVGRINSLRTPEVVGANVTIPHKTSVIGLIDKCDPLATRVGAVNTIVNHNGCLTGYNTDVQGFIRALAESAAHLFPGTGKRAILLGTGGAARAAAVGLLEQGFTELILVGRTSTHLATLQQHLQKLAAQHRIPETIHTRLLGSSDLADLLAHTDLLVNATPVGLQESDRQMLIDIKALPQSAVVMDMIFNPPQTPLLCAAQAHGCQALNGLTMLLYQGARAFELWTGQPAPVEVMRKALES